MASKISKRQQSTITRVEGIDPEATHRVVENVVEISYTPRWERGRVTGGVYRENPNPQRVTHVITEDGRIHGWGFGPSISKLELPADVKPTTAENMAAALKERVASRRPVKDEVEVETEPTPEVEVEKPKTTTRKPAAKKRATAKRSGVVVSK
jgi:hypothetical protein